MAKLLFQGSSDFCFVLYKIFFLILVFLIFFIIKLVDILGIRAIEIKLLKKIKLSNFKNPGHNFPFEAWHDKRILILIGCLLIIGNFLLYYLAFPFFISNQIWFCFIKYKIIIKNILIQKTVTSVIEIFCQIIYTNPFINNLIIFFEI